MSSVASSTLAASSDVPALIIVMGTCGCGKSSIGLAVAQQLGCAFVDGDDLHPAANVAKMSEGHPLNDQDRIPWLQSIRRAAIQLTSEDGLALLAASSPLSKAAEASSTSSAPTQSPSHELTQLLLKVHPDTVSLEQGQKMQRRKRKCIVIGCSALRRCYRDLLSGREARCSPELVAPATDPNSQELETYFLYLHGTRPLLLARMERRPGHFMKASMLDSQLATLETPDPDTEVGGHGHIAVVKLGKGADESEEVGIEGVASAAVAEAEKWVGGAV